MVAPSDAQYCANKVRRDTHVRRVVVFGEVLQSCGVEWRWAQLVVVSDVEGVGYRGDDHGCHCCVSSFSGPNSQSEDEWNHIEEGHVICQVPTHSVTGVFIICLNEPRLNIEQVLPPLRLAVFLIHQCPEGATRK